jgi:hypothetical protein
MDLHPALPAAQTLTKQINSATKPSVATRARIVDAGTLAASTRIAGSDAVAAKRGARRDQWRRGDGQHISFSCFWGVLGDGGEREMRHITRCERDMYCGRRMGKGRAGLQGEFVMWRPGGNELGSEEIDERAFRERRRVCLRARCWGARVEGGGSWEVVLRRICGGGLHYMRLISTRHRGDEGCYSDAVGQCRTAVSLYSSDLFGTL